MTGAVLAACGLATSPPSAGAVSPGALDWSDAYGTDTAITQAIAIAGTGPITVTASRTGGGLLGYALNGNPALYTGGFLAHPGDQLSWFISVPPLGTSSVAGTVTVANATGGATLDTFNYVVNSSRGSIP